MGCFFSTIKKDQSSLKSHATKSNSIQEVKTVKCRIQSPPPLPHVAFEEETVKEVLLETPISKPQVPILIPETKTQLPILQTRKDPIYNKALEEASDEVSLISETCSFSTTTTTAATVPETREDEVTSKRSTITRKRSYTVDGNRIGGRERRRKSPAENPPEKKVMVGSRSVRRREFSDQVRRDPGEGSSRRSRSPGGVGRRLPAPVRSEMVDEERNDGVLMEESFENPYVSMECFIFL